MVQHVVHGGGVECVPGVLQLPYQRRYDAVQCAVQRLRVRPGLPDLRWCC